MLTIQNELNRQVALLLGRPNAEWFNPMELAVDWGYLFTYLSLSGRSPQLTFDHMNVHGKPIYWAMVGIEKNVESATACDAYGSTPGEALCNAFLLACGVYAPTVTRRCLELIEDAPVSTPTWATRRMTWGTSDIVIHTELDQMYKDKDR